VRNGLTLEIQQAMELAIDVGSTWRIAWHGRMPTALFQMDCKSLITATIRRASMSTICTWPRMLRIRVIKSGEGVVRPDYSTVSTTGTQSSLMRLLSKFWICWPMEFCMSL
jgi:hypothetical protein